MYLSLSLRMRALAGWLVRTALLVVVVLGALIARRYSGWWAFGSVMAVGPIAVFVLGRLYDASLRRGGGDPAPGDTGGHHGL